MANEKVSIIVPVYNVEAYLIQCLDSIITQTYHNLEIILVDDGSPDNCGAICDAYAAKDSRIRVIHQKNGGLSAARNAGLDIATGEYIAFVDSDDWIAGNMVERLLDSAKTSCADLAVCDVAIYYEDTGVQPHECPMHDDCFSREVLIRKMTEPQAWHYIVVCNKLFHRHIFRKIRFPEGFIHEDAAIAHHIASECTTVVTLKEELYFYRQNPKSIQGSPFSICRTDNLSALADRIQFSYRKGWEKMWKDTSVRYVHSFFDLYFRFEQGDEKYLRRMEASLKMALPYVLRSNQVSLRHKCYLLLIRVNPKLYRVLKKAKSRK